MSFRPRTSERPSLRGLDGLDAFFALRIVRAERAVGIDDGGRQWLAQRGLWPLSDDDYAFVAEQDSAAQFRTRRL